MGRLPDMAPIKPQFRVDWDDDDLRRAFNVRLAQDDLTPKLWLEREAQRYVGQGYDTLAEAIDDLAKLTVRRSKGAPNTGNGSLPERADSPNRKLEFTPAAQSAMNATSLLAPERHETPMPPQVPTQTIPERPYRGPLTKADQVAGKLGRKG